MFAVPSPRYGALLVLLLAAALPTPRAAAQTFRTDDAVLRRMWTEGMERSQAERLAQVLMDSIGPRLSGAPGYDASGEWLTKVYGAWGITARREQYGTWRGWDSGRVVVELTSPRHQNLEVNLLGWSPGTNGPVEGEVVAVPEFGSEADVAAWLGTVRGRVVLASAPESTCREPQSFQRLARPETFSAWQAQRQATQASWARRIQMLGGAAGAHRRIEEAGAAAVLTSQWSEGWGVIKVFGAMTQRVPSLAVSCEDFGLLHRLAANRQGPRVRIDVAARDLGAVPMFNVIAEIRGSELPNEYVMLSAHLDSWHAATGATDNGTGTIMMLEAMRILRAHYPNPRRTILVGHWGGEEQGLIGSRAFAEDNPRIVENLQVLFNQDNGTWRVDYIQAQGLLGASANLARWVASLPTEISREVTLDLPGPQETGGSDHVAFLCYGAPGFRLQSHYPEYRQYTWHTNRDTFDKIVFDDLRNNATLAAMLAYLASEDPQRVPRDRSVLPPGPGGQPRNWLNCAPPRRSFQ
jgi:carboxypeptidase Q